jgi:hypothetical protein
MAYQGSLLAAEQRRRHPGRHPDPKTERLRPGGDPPQVDLDMSAVHLQGGYQRALGVVVFGGMVRRTWP